MENIWDNKWNNNRYLEYTGNPNLEGNRDSSGSRWGDALAGIGQLGLMASRNNKPAQNYLDINYVGNGLAKSSIGSMQNYDYKNPYLFGEYWKNNMRKNRYRFGYEEDDIMLAYVFGNVGTSKILGNIVANDFIKSNYPTSIYDTSWNNGDTIYNYQSPQYNPIDYLCGGRYADFGKTVNDYLEGM
jgi:hypothetical protein